MIEAMKKENVGQVARLHYNSLPDDFLPSLGLYFLEKVFFRATLTSEYGKTFVYTDKDKVLGFITVAHDSPAFFKNIFFSNVVRIVWTFISKVLLNFRLLAESLSIMLSLFGSSKQDIKPEIIFIAVDETHRGKGIGSELIATAMAYIREKGYGSCKVKTLIQNRNAVAMYSKAGFETKQKLILAGKKYLIMVNEGALNEPW